MMRIALILLPFIALVSCSEAQSDNANSVNKVVASEEFKQMLSGDVQLIDVRTADEYSAGKIGDAQNIDFYATDFKAQLEKLDKNKTTLVYCQAGGRSGKAAIILQEMGFKTVYDLKGGYGNWPFK